MRFDHSLSTLLLAASAALSGGCAVAPPGPPTIAFAPYGSGYASKPDFNDVEYRFPLSSADRTSITPENLEALDQEQLDQIYARLTAGAMPDGAFDGAILLPRGGVDEVHLAELADRFGASGLQLKALALGDLAVLWRGKVFDRDRRILRNRIEDLTELRKLRLIDGDPKPDTIDGRTTWLLFPAKVYCGQSLLDARRESIVADYAFADDIPGYRERPDFVAGRRGLRVRDEMRMVRPGFYLGRAYVDRVFALNFTLYRRDLAEREGPRLTADSPVDEACWPGTQAHRTASRR